MMPSPHAVPIDAVDPALRAQGVCRQTVAGHLLPNQRLIEPLTGRELEVLELVCDGESNQDIASRLGIGVATVKYHLLQIFGKLGASRRTQAVAIAIHLGLVRPGWLLTMVDMLEGKAAA